LALAQQHADHRDRPHREGIEHADVEVGDHEVGTDGDDGVDEERRHHRHERGRLVDERVRSPRHQVLLLEELDAFHEHLQRAVRTGLHRAEAALHVGHHLEEEDVAQDHRPERDDAEDHGHLDGRLHRVRQREQLHQRSMSPRMK
jgi:hypothetical protein